jgi:hypothetical protein
MIGISGDNLMWINHFIFTVSRTHPKLNLQKLTLKNSYAETKGMMVKRKSLMLIKGSGICFYTVFIDHEMKEGVTKLCVLLLCFLFITFDVFCFFFFSLGRFFVESLTWRK